MRMRDLSDRRIVALRCGVAALAATVALMTPARAQTITGTIPGVDGTAKITENTTKDFVLVVKGGAITDTESATISFDGNWTGSFYIGGKQNDLEDTLQISGNATPGSNGNFFHSSQPDPKDEGNGSLFEFNFLAILDASGTEKDRYLFHNRVHYDRYTATLTYTLEPGDTKNIASYNFTLTGHHDAREIVFLAPEPTSAALLFFTSVFLVGVTAGGGRMIRGRAG